MSIKIAIIGGTGMGQLLGSGEIKRIDTPYGPASIHQLSVDGKEVLFVDRHHLEPRHEGDSVIFRLPNQLNHKAYMYALYNAGVQFVIAASAVGGINGPNDIDDLEVGSIVTPEDFIDLSGGPYTFAREGDLVHEEAFHRSPVDMFCPVLRDLVARHVDCAGGILSCVKGPRYETPAEVRVLCDQFHANFLGMTTAVPETVLAREASMHYLLFGTVTNMPLEGPPADGAEVKEAIKRAQARLIKIINPLIHILANTAPEFECECISSPSVFELCK
ncbi:MTAP family purine nucleoside phosphorylase [bacterium]|jgi:5'-methylthioadenosine phosphorylase|nr:MTAP family purine nucleoside phosphorylase [bacterium]